MFKNLFGKGKEPAKQDPIAEAVNKSTLKMLNHELFMHYYDENTPPNPQDQGWRNQGIFFWAATEPFEKKSLPPEFKEFEHRFFIVNGVPDSLTLSASIVMPWFGMPGGGEKLFFSEGEAHIPIDALVQAKILSYVDIIDLNEGNLHILTNREQYYLLLGDDVDYEPSTDTFYFQERETTLGGAYKAGGIQVIRFR
jgi:hypothetical protein